MAQTTIWKPSTINSWKGGIAFLADANGPRTPPTVTGPDGKTYTGKFVNTNEGRHQWLFPSELANMQGLKISYNGQTGTIESGATSYEGGGLGSWQARAKGSIGAGGYSGIPGQFTPGQVGQFGATPAYIGGMFPSPFLMTTAPYEFTDPMKYAEKFGNFNRGEIRKNFDLSKELALETLDTELASLKDFVPAAAAIKRQETSIDNVFNQAERTKQIDSTLPGVRGQLERQSTRAEAFAEGRIPDEIQDRAFELGVRSASADQSAAGGFGAQSSVARKSSDLFSATQRINLSQYGDRALTTNIGARAALLLAPTEYSNAGMQVNVMPSLSASQQIGNNMNMVNNLASITAGQGLSSTTQQNQFTTSLEQQTRTINASAQNQFALAEFGYNAGFANSVAGAAQNDINTNFQLQQQQMYNDLMAKYLSQAQSAQGLSSIFSGAFSLIGGLLKPSGGEGGGGGGLGGMAKGGGGGGGDALGEIGGAVGK